MVVPGCIKGRVGLRQTDRKAFIVVQLSGCGVPLQPPTAGSPHTLPCSFPTLFYLCCPTKQQNQAGRPPRKRIEVEGGTPAPPKARPANKTAKPAAAARAVSSSAATSARAQAAAKSAGAVADRRPSTARAGSSISSSSSNSSAGSARGGRRADTAVEEPRPGFRSRREQDDRARGGYAHEDAGSSDGEMGCGNAAEDVEDEEMRPGSGGRSAGRGSRHGRRYVGGGTEGAKRSSRSSSSAESEESFVEGQTTARWDPLTPPDRRFRAAGSSPGCVFFFFFCRPLLSVSSKSAVTLVFAAWCWAHVLLIYDPVSNRLYCFAAVEGCLLSLLLVYHFLMIQSLITSGVPFDWSTLHSTQGHDRLEQTYPRRELQGPRVRFTQPAQLLPQHARRHGHVAILHVER